MLQFTLTFDALNYKIADNFLFLGHMKVNLYTKPFIFSLY